ncbi:amino acid permease [Rhodococcus sp. NKCM2511]|uniref:APC family permease n=1 Tax=Rhodococcus sp. NKCM2511 TaxID=2766011 RepID=UPI001910A3DF|nr:APC family permease [Rhodococcus sp. NKCM2511]MBY4403358.1 APC family permease [Rhodococcus fascians]MBY4414729.1 APC family permease [Rhodococcus fascians]GHP18406.1 amino acid permease [Rhodococcus sp. NKCM2511]
MSTTQPSTSSNSPDPAAGAVATERGGLRPGRLGVTAIIFFVVAAVAPMAAIVGASPVVFSASGSSAPMVYLLAALLFVLFAAGYVAMSRHITNAGGFVAYIARGLGARVATAGAGLAILFYGTLQASLWALFSVFAHDTIASKLGIDIPRALIMFVVLVAVTGLTMLGIDLSLKVLGVLVALEIVVFVILDVAIIAGGGAAGNSLTAFDPSALAGPGLGVAFLFAFACFTGFEATVVFSEEAKNPRRTIPRAIYGSIAFIGLFYAVTTWALGNSVGNDTVQAAATEDPAGFVFAVAQQEVGTWLATTLEILVVTSFIAMLIGFQNMFARYLYALGRAGVLPHRLGTAAPTSGTPRTAAAVVGIVVGIVLIGFELAGADAYTVTYSWLLALGTTALIVILIMTSISIFAFFARTKLETNPWTTKISPVLAVIGFAYVAYLAVSNYDVLLGGQGGIAQWLLLLIPIFAIAGFLWATIRPSVNYEAELV